MSSRSRRRRRTSPSCDPVRAKAQRGVRSAACVAPPPSQGRRPARDQAAEARVGTTVEPGAGTRRVAPRRSSNSSTAPPAPTTMSHEDAGRDRPPRSTSPASRGAERDAPFPVERDVLEEHQRRLHCDLRLTGLRRARTGGSAPPRRRRLTTKPTTLPKVGVEEQVGRPAELGSRAGARDAGGADGELRPHAAMLSNRADAAQTSSAPARGGTNRHGTVANTAGPSGVCT